MRLVGGVIGVCGVYCLEVTLNPPEVAKTWMVPVIGADVAWIVAAQQLIFNPRYASVLTRTGRAVVGASAAAVTGILALEVAGLRRLA